MPKTYPDEIKEAVQTKAYGEPRWSAAQMREWLVREYPDLDPRRDLPQQRRIYDWMAEEKARSRGEPWTLADERNPADAQLVTDVIREVTVRTEGKGRATKAEAYWIVRVRRARPDLHPWIAYRFARRYVVVQEQIAAGKRAGYDPLDRNLAIYGDQKAMAAVNSAPLIPASDSVFLQREAGETRDDFIARAAALLEEETDDGKA